MITPKKIFSIPLNPKLNEQQFNDFYEFCSQYRDWIYDIYFTSRISPFDQDAMGDVFILQQDTASLIENAWNIARNKLEKEKKIYVKGTYFFIYENNGVPVISEEELEETVRNVLIQNKNRIKQ